MSLQCVCLPKARALSVHCRLSCFFLAGAVVHEPAPLSVAGLWLHAVCASPVSDPLHAVVFYGYPGGAQSSDMNP